VGHRRRNRRVALGATLATGVLPATTENVGLFVALVALVALVMYRTVA